jgi:chromate reductase
MKKFIAISGSLRKGSYNTNLLHAAVELAGEGVEIQMFDISSLPLYNQDTEAPFPEGAQALKDAIKNADGVIFATPEHNRSIPSALKNAIDWASRPWGQNSFATKSVLVLGASVGPIGTAVAQNHLKQILLYLDAHVIGQPEFYLGVAQDKFDGDGKLTDETTKEHLKKALEVLASR